MSVKEVVQHVAQDPKVASGVSAITTGAGLGTILDWIPNDIGKLATLVGIVLSLVLIWVHGRKGRLEHKKIQLEIALLEKQDAMLDP